MNFKIAIGNDHAGFELKEKIILKLQEEGYEFKNFGSFTNASCDYPDYGHKLANKIQNKEVTTGNRLTDDILDLFNIWLVK